MSVVSSSVSEAEASIISIVAEEIASVLSAAYPVADAVIVAWPMPRPLAVALALMAPSGMVTLASMPMVAGSLLTRLTTWPPAGAGEPIVTGKLLV